MSDKKYNSPLMLRNLTKAQVAREDCTALCLAKMVAIAEDKTRAYFQLVDEICTTKERAQGVIHSLMGLVVQYAEGSGGFLRLCSHLVRMLEERKLDEFPVQSKWVSSEHTKTRP